MRAACSGRYPLIKIALAIPEKLMILRNLTAALTIGSVLLSASAHATSPVNADAAFALTLSQIGPVVDGGSSVPRAFSRQEVMRMMFGSLSENLENDEQSNRIIGGVALMGITSEEYKTDVQSLAKAMLESKNSRIRLRVVRAVGSILSIQIVIDSSSGSIGETLLASLYDADAEVRIATAKALGSVVNATNSGFPDRGNPIYANLLLVAARDVDAKVREAAVTALTSIKSRRSGV